jgi:hypothetical protein
MKLSFLEIIERQELIQKLIDNGYGKIIDILLLNENKVYTKKGRLNKSGACRLLGCKPKELEETMQRCRDILKKEMEGG